MYKTLCVAVALLGIAVLTSGSVSSPNTSRTPVIVASAKFVNQSKALSTTIFTPTQDGVYRVSAYATITQHDPSSQSYWQYGLGWTDDAGPQAAVTIFYQYGKNSGQFLNDISVQNGGQVRTIAAKAGTAMTQNMMRIGPTDSSTYNLYYVVEQLQ